MTSTCQPAGRAAHAAAWRLMLLAVLCILLQPVAAEGRTVSRGKALLEARRAALLAEAAARKPAAPPRRFPPRPKATLHPTQQEYAPLPPEALRAPTSVRHLQTRVAPSCHGVKRGQNDPREEHCKPIPFSVLLQHARRRKAEQAARDAERDSAEHLFASQPALASPLEPTEPTQTEAVSSTADSAAATSASPLLPIVAVFVVGLAVMALLFAARRRGAAAAAAALAKKKKTPLLPW
eukprot:PLAT15505.10.p1 GENE.PLAT15505.10~~PLAT15505.10.p1  ORF type:complete len:237 (+),score=55.54 PLAT15505.10:49-759(+)